MPRHRRKPSLAPVGRYDLREAVMPPGEQLGEPTAVRRRHTRVGTVNVIAPNGEPVRQLATINIRTDLLELELAHDRISHPAFLEGREIQRHFEQAMRTGAGNQWNSGDRVDQFQRKEEQVVKQLETARRIDADAAWLRRCLGKESIDPKIIRNILGDNMSYGATALLHGKRGDRGVRYIAQRFRDSLEILAKSRGDKEDFLAKRQKELANAQAAKGRGL